MQLFPKAKCVHVRKGLSLPRASHFGEIALVGSRRLRSSLVAALVLVAHAFAIKIEFRTDSIITLLLL